MSEFWPKGLSIGDARSPLDILQEARKDWEENSGGILTLVFQETTSTTGNRMIVVHAKHIPGNRTVRLFSVVHRPKCHYPLAIQPEVDDLQDFLRKTYYRPGIAEVGIAGLGGIGGRTVTNEWVSDTPSEFRGKLKEVLNLGSIKQAVQSLALHSPVAEENHSDDNCNNSPPES